MAEGDIQIANHAKELMLLGDSQFDAHNFRIILLGVGFSWDVDGNQGYADTAITSNEIITTGYTATGKPLAGLSVTQDDANDWAKWDAADVTWTALGTTVIDHALIYNDTITAAPADPIICHVEITTDSNGNDYTISWHANGIFYLT